MYFYENEAEYGSAKIIKSFFTENKSSITFVLEEQISSNFQDLFAKTFDIKLSNFNNCNISTAKFSSF